MIRDWRAPEMTLREHALCQYAAKATHHPAKLRQDDIDGLRAAGLSDREVLDLVHVIGFFAYANRLVDALGCDLEEGMDLEFGHSGRAEPERNGETRG